MTDKTDLIREIHEYVTTHGGENTATHLLVQAASAIQTQAAELEAIGAGGVNGPLMGQPQAMPDLSQLTERGAKAWAGVDAQGLREGADMHKERAGRFTKKPVTIDAWLIDFGNKPLPDWVNEAFRTEAIDWCPAGEGLYINTLEGCMLGANGSWLIKGVQGELYACKPDIFAATYECASLSANAGEPVAWLESEPSTKDWPVRDLFFGFTRFAYSSRLHMGEKPKGADQSQNRFTPLYAAPPTAQAEGWRPISTAPKDEIYRDGQNAYAKYILIWYSGALVPLRARWWQADSGANNFLADGGWAVFPTHWMPLPPPPTSAEGVEHG